LPLINEDVSLELLRFEVLLAINCPFPDIFTGLAEVSEGEVNGHEIHLLSNSVARISFGADPQVLKVQIENYKLSLFK